MRLQQRLAAARDERERGVTALELAVLAPSLLLLIFLIIQLALFLYGRSVALQTAREGLSQLRLAQTRSAYDGLQPTVDDDMTRFASSVGGGMLVATDASSSYDDRAGSVTVSVTGETLSLVPGLHLHVTQQATAPIERFRMPPETGQVGH